MTRSGELARVLAGWLAALLLALSATPCQLSFAAARGQATITAPGDPCHAPRPAPAAAACAQLACQVLAAPADRVSAEQPSAGRRAVFDIASALPPGRDIAPVDPPPRTPVKERL